MRRLERFLVAEYDEGTRGYGLKCTFCDSIPVYTLRTTRRLHEGRPLDGDLTETEITVRYSLCAAHGAPHFEPTDSFLVQSDSDPGKEHEIHYPLEGPWSCDCESFKYSRALPIGVIDEGAPEDLRAAMGWCRHLERKQRELVGLPDISGKICEGCGLEWRDRSCDCKPYGKPVTVNA